MSHFELAFFKLRLNGFKGNHGSAYLIIRGLAIWWKISWVCGGRSGRWCKEGKVVFVRLELGGDVLDVVG